MKIQRLKKVENYIKEKEICTYEELSSFFNISLSTIHRDIDELVKLGNVEKKHGGAAYKKSEEEEVEEFTFLPYEYTKDSIARKAADTVEDNDIILLGSGLTVAHMVPYLKVRKNITVITNNFMVIAEAMKYGFNVITIGGNLDRNVMSFVGTQSIKQISELNANKAFIGCNGIGFNGISNVVDLEADIKKKMIEISASTTVLAESKKFGAMSLYKICGFDAIDTLVTDALPDEEMQAKLAEKGVKILISK